MYWEYVPIYISNKMLHIDLIGSGWPPQTQKGEINMSYTKNKTSVYVYENGNQIVAWMLNGHWKPEAIRAKLNKKGIKQQARCAHTAYYTHRCTYLSPTRKFSA